MSRSSSRPTCGQDVPISDCGEPQLFPTKGFNLNLGSSELLNQIGRANGQARSYIVSSVWMHDSGQHFEQYGSGPNFQGGRLSLCTCMHKMRASLVAREWEGTWIAGFTSRSRYQHRHWLFYLMRVQKAYESHAELWERLPAAARKMKSSRRNFLGDVFVPRGRVVGEGRFDPGRYYEPSCHSHHRNSCDNGWRNDIDYWCAERYGRPWLLVGDPKVTFLWNEPLIYLDHDHCRNFKKWDSIKKLLKDLMPPAGGGNEL